MYISRLCQILYARPEIGPYYKLTQFNWDNSYCSFWHILEQCVQCGIQVQAQSSGTDNRPCTLNGTASQVAAAKKMLQDVIVNGKIKDEQNRAGQNNRPNSQQSYNRGNNNAQNGGGGRHNGNQHHNNHHHQQQQPPQQQRGPWQPTQEEFLVPPDKVGTIIGKGGQNLKALRTKFSVQVELIQKDSDPPGTNLNYT